MLGDFVELKVPSSTERTLLLEALGQEFAVIFVEVDEKLIDLGTDIDTRRDISLNVADLLEGLLARERHVVALTNGKAAEGPSAHDSSSPVLILVADREPMLKLDLGVESLALDRAVVLAETHHSLSEVLLLLGSELLHVLGEIGLALFLGLINLKTDRVNLGLSLKRRLLNGSRIRCSVLTFSGWRHTAQGLLGQAELS